nr:hypothetical protein GCM10020093_109590 [Planobispora longispora]
MTDVVSDQGRHSPLSPPDAADLVLDFVNTRPIDGRAERLADASATGRWLRATGLVHTETLITEADAAAARELRQALVTVLLAHAGEPDGDGATLEAAEAYLRRSGAMYPLSPVITADDVRLLPAQVGVAGAFGALLAAVADLARKGTWTRVKACRNPLPPGLLRPHPELLGGVLQSEALRGAGRDALLPQPPYRRRGGRADRVGGPIGGSTRMPVFRYPSSATRRARPSGRPPEPARVSWKARRSPRPAAM